MENLYEFNMDASRDAGCVDVWETLMEISRAAKCPLYPGHIDTSPTMYVAQADCDILTFEEILDENKIVYSKQTISE